MDKNFDNLKTQTGKDLLSVINLLKLNQCQINQKYVTMPDNLEYIAFRFLVNTLV